MSAQVIPTPISTLLELNPNSVVSRPIADFKPSPWGTRFLDYTFDAHNKVIEAQQEQAKELKEEIKRELLLLCERPLLEQLCFIDSIERLGLAYQFEKEIDEILQLIHDKDDSSTLGDLFLTSLRFRILRQHGFIVTSDVFKGFIGTNGSLKDDVASDVEGMLSLYEACHVRGHEDTILDQILNFTTSKLMSLHGNPRASHALKKPLHKRMSRLECVHHMQVYEQNPSHNKTLLSFAKLDFNLLQSSQKKELSDMCRGSKGSAFDDGLTVWAYHVFKGFIGSNGSLKDDVASDVEGMLSLYEACHVRGHEDTILDQILNFTTSKLMSLHGNPRASHALKKPLHKRMSRLECVHHMQVYEQNPSHNKTLLSFAKLDFNLLQSSQKKELSDMCRWWKRIDLSSKLPSRDRIVEAYFWASAVYFEPQCHIGRKICTMACQLMTSVDDIYDAYATLEELEIFTKAVDRWDKSCLHELPEYMRPYYQALILDAFDEMEHDLAAKGRSQYVYYAREEMKALCQSYLLEAKWRQRKYVPTLDEYLENAVRTSTFGLTTVFTFLDMDMATHAEFEWVRTLPKPVEAIYLLLRLLDDIGGHKFDKDRDHASSSIDCYMRQYGVSSEEACKEIQKRADEVWKDINQAMIPPTDVPMPLLKCILNLGRSVEAIYDGGEDGFTSINEDMKENITNLYINPIPM